MNGRLGGIARHDRPRGAIETLDHVSVTRELGVRGDLRGAIRPGKSGRRQVSLIEAESWEAAVAELRPTPDHDLPWHVRRANLLVQGIRLPREPGKVIAIGKSDSITNAAVAENNWNDFGSAMRSHCCPKAEPMKFTTL